MFLKAIKDFFVKKSLRENAYPTMHREIVTKIKTIGVLVDAAFVEKLESVKQVLATNGFKNEMVTVIVFDEKNKFNKDSNLSTFDFESVSYNGDFKDGFVLDFIESNFDLLISFYQNEKSVLLAVTKQSKAKLKVGFEMDHYKFNDLNIKLKTSDLSLFSIELIKYLKILNKI